MIGALSSSAVLAMMTIPGSTDGDVFLELVVEIAIGQLGDDHQTAVNDVVAFDG